MGDLTQASTKAGGLLAATCRSTLVVNANTSAVSILLPAISENAGTIAPISPISAMARSRSHS